MWTYNHTDELRHYGVLGMKWGVRRDKRKSNVSTRAVRGHAGPGVYLGSKERKLAGAKRDLKILDQGGHLSFGMTKKKQEAYDKRDRALLEKKISELSKNEIEKGKKAASPYSAYTLVGIALATGVVAKGVSSFINGEKTPRG